MSGNLIWKPVANYEGLYEVSQRGDIRSVYRYRKTLRPSLTKNGYLSVELFKNKIGKRLLVHRIVAQAFIPNPNKEPQVNHKDENKQNNCVDNLEWCSAKYNMNYGKAAKTRHLKIDYSRPIYAENARKNGATTSKPVLQFTKTGAFVARFASGKEAHRQTGVSHSHILECCSGKRYKTVGGYIWKFEERGDALLASQS